VAVGSGVISDLVKWVAFELNIPYVAVATAASMNGYASDNVAPTVQGVKRLVQARGPVAILTTPEILASAPFELTASGFGDIWAKSVSSADWRLNRILFDEYYCPLCVELQRDIEPFCLANAEKIAMRSPEAMQGLFDALVLTGVLQSMAGTSSPASGGEHVISHCLDMMSSLDRRPHDLHGRQVGVGTVVAAALYEEVMRLERPRFRDLSSDTDGPFWGRLTPAVDEPHARKKQKVARAVEAFQGDGNRWSEAREQLRPMLQSPGVIKDALRRARAAHRLTDIGADRDRFLNALLHAHEIRDRYTIIDLARSVGVLPERAEEIVDRWVLR
jgi:glycerol-1-phosphate dehydrogenase [NAD(P)+]